MYTVFHIKASELNENFLRSIKTMFKSKKISITVEEDIDETDYLLRSESNRRMLKESMEQAEKGELITVNIGKAGKK